MMAAVHLIETSLRYSGWLRYVPFGGGSGTPHGHSERLDHQTFSRAVCLAEWESHSSSASMAQTTARRWRVRGVLQDSWAGAYAAIGRWPSGDHSSGPLSQQHITKLLRRDDYEQIKQLRNNSLESTYDCEYALLFTHRSLMCYFNQTRHICLQALRVVHSRPLILIPTISASSRSLSRPTVTAKAGLGSKPIAMA